MKTLADTRKELGLSQRELALHLGISRALLYKAEKNMCTLPSALLHKLAELEKKSKSCARVLIPDCKGSNAIENYCRKRITDNLYSIMLLERNLALLQEKYTVLIKDLPLLPEDESDEDIKNIINLRINRTARKASICGPDAQEKLQLKIFLLRADIKAIEQFLCSRQQAND